MLTKSRIIAIAAALVVAADARAQARPGPPRNVWVGVFGPEIVMSWLPMIPERITGFEVEFRRIGLGPVAIVRTAGNSLRVTAPPGTQGEFEVVVRTIVDDLVSDNSAPVRFMLGGPCVPPSAPSGLTSSLSGASLSLHWNAADGASEYILEAGSRSGASDLYNQSVGLMTTFFATVPAGLHAFVRVRSRSACGPSGPSNEVELANPRAVHWRGITAQGLPIDFDIESGNVLNLRMQLLGRSSNPLCDRERVVIGWQDPVPIVAGSFRSARRDNAWRVEARIDSATRASGTASFEFTSIINDKHCVTGASTTWTAAPQ